jgi:hypothetical protein
LGECLVSWLSNKKSSISLSTAEAEYIAAASCCSQDLWMKQTLTIYRLSMMNPFQYIVIIQAPSVSQKIGDELQDEAHSNQVSPSTGTGCKEEHQS